MTKFVYKRDGVKPDEIINEKKAFKTVIMMTALYKYSLSLQRF